MWFGMGAILGWPFSGVLIVPFVVEELAIAIISGDTLEVFRRFLDGTVRCLIVLVRRSSPLGTSGDELLGLANCG
jgi:alpha-1,2-mannosyltransferase